MFNLLSLAKILFAIVVALAGTAFGQPVHKLMVAGASSLNQATSSRLPMFPNGSAGVVALLPDAPKGWKPRYTESQCMVQVRLSLNGKPLSAREWFEISGRSGVYWLFVAPQVGIAASNYQAHKKSVFLLYAKNCKQRFSLAKRFFSSIKAMIIGFPDFKVLTNRVTPSVQTLSICGHWWKDGMKGKCHTSLASTRASRDCPTWPDESTK